MTNTELIQAIKAEIERLKGQLIRGACAAQIEMETNCKEAAYNEVLSFLSTLESEKPMEQDGLEEEIKRTYHDGSVADTSDLDHNSYENIARHFYDLGKKDMKEQMMKEVVEGTAICYCDGTYCVESPCFDNNGYYKSGDKVRIIIVKEDEK